MEFIRTNAGSIIVGFLVLAALVFTVYRMVNRLRKKKTGCGCTGCLKCP
ncbi:MAG: FeoB-associated Cys-rich membrane protein [Treponema sp.]|nr:FeoB-associated Cys-rich membrane protein [Treponema sp.]